VELVLSPMTTVEMLDGTRAGEPLAPTKESKHEHEAGNRRSTSRPGKPMRVTEIIEAGVPLATSLKGRTPGQTFYSVLYSESKKADGLVVQTGRGEFRLNPKRRR
jgi:hypothetical protein